MSRDAMNFTETIPIFDGTGDINVFIRILESKIKIQKLDQAQSYKVLANKITGSAFDNFMLNQDDLNTYSKLKEFLIKTYDRKRKKLFILSSLFADRQDDNENIEQYYLRLTFKLNDAKIENFNSNTESGKIYLFGYIAQTMKTKLKSQLPPTFDPQDLDELMSELRNLDSYDSSFTQETQSTPYMQLQNQANDSMETYFTPNTNFKNTNRVQFQHETPRNFQYRRNSGTNRRLHPYNNRGQNYSNQSQNHSFNSSGGNSPNQPKNWKNRALLPPP